jgi:hypothetical protein
MNGIDSTIAGRGGLRQKRLTTAYVAVMRHVAGVIRLQGQFEGEKHGRNPKLFSTKKMIVS